MKANEYATYCLYHALNDAYDVDSDTEPDNSDPARTLARALVYALRGFGGIDYALDNVDGGDRVTIIDTLTEIIHTAESDGCAEVARQEESRREMLKDPIYLLQIRHYHSWQTESVWLSREESEAEGARAYGMEDRNRRWRVYCVPAKGALVPLLNRAICHLENAWTEMQKGSHE